MASGSEIREFLTTRRARITPDQAGLSAYGGRRRVVPTELEGLALHAAGLGFVHPVTQQRVEFSSALPLRIERLLSHLRHEA